MGNHVAAGGFSRMYSCLWGDLLSWFLSGKVRLKVGLWVALECGGIYWANLAPEVI
jgi:hypothetical protein